MAHSNAKDRPRSEAVHIGCICTDTTLMDYCPVCWLDDDD